MAEDLAHSETNTIRKFIDVMLKENSSKEMDLLRIWKSFEINKMNHSLMLEIYEKLDLSRYLLKVLSPREMDL